LQAAVIFEEIEPVSLFPLDTGVFYCTNGWICLGTGAPWPIQVFRGSSSKSGHFGRFPVKTIVRQAKRHPYLWKSWTSKGIQIRSHFANRLRKPGATPYV
jgi:hypothetical protein